MNSIQNSLTIDVPWGKIASVSWGDPQKPPVLLVHGRLDSLATFVPLVALLPPEYYYVAVDLPGHGKSDPFPKGVLLISHYVAALDLVVKKMGWKSLYYIGHSMGAELGLFYNKIRPGKITKLVMLDVGLSLLRLTQTSVSTFFSVYQNYYKNYEYFERNYRTYTLDEARAAVKNARGLSPHLIDLVLSRNLVKVPHSRHNEESTQDKPIEETYKLAWDQRLKHLMHLNLSLEQYLQIFTINLPQTVLFAATESINKLENEPASKIMHEICRNENVRDFKVNGGHDFHLTEPSLIAEEIGYFLKNHQFCKRREVMNILKDSKL